jgi:hypothetical protein
MTDSEINNPFLEAHEPELRRYDEEAPSLDSEIDFDDEREEDQLTLDVVEAIEVGVLLDNPEELSEDEEEA